MLPQKGVFGIVVPVPYGAGVVEAHPEVHEGPEPRQLNLGSQRGINRAKKKNDYKTYMCIYKVLLREVPRGVAPER